MLDRTRRMTWLPRKSVLGNVRLQQLLEEMGLQACETQCNTQCKMLKKSLRTLKKVENVDALDLRLHLGEISEPND